MRFISFESVLTVILIIPFIMNYRLSPGTTPYWLFTLIFAAMLIYILIDLLKINERKLNLLKQILLWFLIFGVVGSAFFSVIIVRHQTAPVYGVHDIILQLESAIRFFLDGKNPYAVNYFNTPLEQWHYSDTEINPALYHFVMQPFYLLFSLPFYFFSISIFGFFDGRMPLFALFVFLLIMASRLIKEPSKKLLFLSILAFNPAMLQYTMEGRSDIFMFSFLFLSFYLLYYKKYFWAGIPMALAFAVKQSVWPILPFYIAFLYFKTTNIKEAIKALVPFILVFVIIVLPFFLWDQKSFLNSTIFYLSGTTLNSYPISGYGFGMLLRELGFIQSLKQNYPFYIWQVLICLPLLVVLLKLLRKVPNVAFLILVYGIFLSVFWYFSRYFNNSHLGYLSLVFITAYFWPKDELK